MLISKTIVPLKLDVLWSWTSRWQCCLFKMLVTSVMWLGTDSPRWLLCGMWLSHCWAWAIKLITHNRWIVWVVFWTLVCVGLCLGGWSNVLCLTNPWKWVTFHS